MRSTAELRAAAAGIRKDVSRVILLSHIQEDYELFHNGGTQNHVTLKMFLGKEVRQFLGAFDLDFLHGATAELADNIRTETAEITQGCMVASDDPNVSEIRTVMSRIHERVNQLQVMRETCSDFFAILKQTEEYLSSFKRILIRFISDEDLLPEELKTKADRTKLIDRYTTDLESYLGLVKGDMELVAALMKEYISARMNNLMRADSAVRLICTEREPERRNNGVQSGNVVTPDCTKDEHGFDITEVG